MEELKGFAYITVVEVGEVGRIGMEVKVKNNYTGELSTLTVSVVNDIKIGDRLELILIKR